MVFPSFVNPCTRDFILKLVCKDPSQRMPWPQILTHPWLKHATRCGAGAGQGGSPGEDHSEKDGVLGEGGSPGEGGGAVGEDGVARLDAQFFTCAIAAIAQLV